MLARLLRSTASASSLFEKRSTASSRNALFNSSGIAGARVAEISIADMRDIYETRVVLEQHAIRAAIPVIS